MPFNAKASEWWRGQTDDQRQALVAGLLPPSFEFVRVERPSRVVLRQRGVLGIAARGEALLNLELSLRAAGDDSIEVMLEPTGDLNKLRTRLRGVGAMQ